MASEVKSSQPADLQERVTRKRVMGIFDVTLFTVSAMLVVETLTASAAIGTKRSPGGSSRSSCS